jgi:hypothetical protein
MIDQEAIERIPAVIPHPAMVIDSLQDLVFESCDDLEDHSYDIDRGDYN